LMCSSRRAVMPEQRAGSSSTPSVPRRCSQSRW
jgi:hypothetical protein